MCNKAVANYPHVLQYVPKYYKTQKCVIKLLILILPQENLFLNPTKLKKCFIEQFIDAFLYLILFLKNIKPKKYVTYLFLYIFLLWYIVLINI